MNDMLFHLPLTERHITAIGYVTANFSLLEHDVNVLIADLLGLKSREDTIAVTANLSFLNKVQLLETLASTKYQEDDVLGKLLREMTEEMKNINTKRNLIVHAQWSYFLPTENRSGVLRQTARGEIKTTIEGFTPEEIMEISISIIEEHSKVQQFLFKKNGVLHFG